MLRLGGLAACLLLTGCSGAEPATTREFPAFGTTVRLELPGTGRDRDAAADEIGAFLRGVENDWYAYGTGELARANAVLGRGEAVTVSADLAAIIARARDIHALSGGLFDPAVCALVRLWQFDREENLAASAGPPPESEVQSVRSHQGTLADLDLEGSRLIPRRPLCIDLGGIAKGTALERIRQLLGRRGIRDALVDLGGSSVLALGERPLPQGGRRAWRIGIKAPRAEGVLALLSLANGEAAATSGDYARAYDRDGRRFHHVLDPRSGQPSGATAGVTVVARDAELADAAATALMVGGPERFDELCAALGIRDALLITTAGDLRTTPAMAMRLRQSNDGKLPGSGSADL